MALSDAEISLRLRNAIRGSKSPEEVRKRVVDAFSPAPTLVTTLDRGAFQIEVTVQLGGDFHSIIGDR